MGSGTFGGIGSGNGVTPPAMPRTTLCIPDGPAACVVYELALDGSGNTTGAPAMDNEGDATRQSTYDVGSPGSPETLLHLVDGRQQPSVTIADGFGFSGVTPTIGVLSRSIYNAMGIRTPYLNLSPTPESSTKPSTSDGGAGSSGLKASGRQTVAGQTERIGPPPAEDPPAGPDAEPEPRPPVFPPVGGGPKGADEGERLRAAQQCACQNGDPSRPDHIEDTDADGTEETEEESWHERWTRGAKEAVKRAKFGWDDLIPGVRGYKIASGIVAGAAAEAKEALNKQKEEPWRLIPGAGQAAHGYDYVRGRLRELGETIEGCQDPQNAGAHADALELAAEVTLTVVAFGVVRIRARVSRPLASVKGTTIGSAVDDAGNGAARTPAGSRATTGADGPGGGNGPKTTAAAVSDTAPNGKPKPQPPRVGGAGADEIQGIDTRPTRVKPGFEAEYVRLEKAFGDAAADYRKWSDMMARYLACDPAVNQSFFKWSYYVDRIKKAEEAMLQAYLERAKLIEIVNE